MIRTNPDPHQHGYRFQPTQAVTAFFAAGQDVQALQRALAQAGFADAHVDIFTGEQGASQLDLSGERHGAWVHFRRALEQVFADEARIYRDADQVLHSGGSVAAVFTGGDEAKIQRAAEVLKANNGQEVLYWGNAVLERL